MRRPSWIWWFRVISQQPTHPSVPACTEGLFHLNLSPYVQGGCHSSGFEMLSQPDSQWRRFRTSSYPHVPLSSYHGGTFQKNIERWCIHNMLTHKYKHLGMLNISYVRGTFCYTQRKRTSLSRKAKGAPGRIWMDRLAKFPWFTTLTHTLILSWQIKHKIFRLNHFFDDFLMKVSMSHKTYIN